MKFLKTLKRRKIGVKGSLKKQRVCPETIEK
jgi:hypothetical protein